MYEDNGRPPGRLADEMDELWRRGWQRQRRYLPWAIALLVALTCGPFLLLGSLMLLALLHALFFCL